MWTLMGLSGSNATSVFHPIILPVPKTLHQLRNTIALSFPVKLLTFFHFPYFLIFVLDYIFFKDGEAQGEGQASAETKKMEKCSQRQQLK